MTGSTIYTKPSDCSSLWKLEPATSAEIAEYLHASDARLREYLAELEQHDRRTVLIITQIVLEELSRLDLHEETEVFP